MLPQSNVFVAAPLKMEHEAELRTLLASMNTEPGVVNPANPLFPFEQFDCLHFARFVILDDRSLDDIHTAYGLPRQDYPLMLAFIADFDGDADSFRAELSARAAGGLGRIFSCCEGYTSDSDLPRWMKERDQPAATMYVNWVGNSLRRIREDNSLRLALETHLQDRASEFTGRSSSEVYLLLKRFVDSEVAAGRLRLSEEPPTPSGWWVRRFIHLIAVPLILLILSPLLLLYLPLFLFQLRRREKNDLHIAPPTDENQEFQLARLEDHDVTNQFTAIGSVKPGLFRRSTLTFFLWLVNYTARHIYNRGHLARVPTIHFARWVFIDEKKRLLFASNYDGSLDSYMDDFINKVGWGLNLVFSNGIGYPTCNWLVLDGSKNEQKFKYFLRRHQLPTEVWYNAHPGLSAVDLKRNILIRQGIDRSDMTDTQVGQWISLL